MNGVMTISPVSLFTIFGIFISRVDRCYLLSLRLSRRRLGTVVRSVRTMFHHCLILPWLLRYRIVPVWSVCALVAFVLLEV